MLRRREWTDEKKSWRRSLPSWPLMGSERKIAGQMHDAVIVYHPVRQDTWHRVSIRATKPENETKVSFKVKDTSLLVPAKCKTTCTAPTGAILAVLSSLDAYEMVRDGSWPKCFMIPQKTVWERTISVRPE